MIFTYLIGVQTSIERHFHFSSQQIGLLPSIGEVGPLLTIVGMSYLSGHGNRPRWMGIGMYIACFGMLAGVVSYLAFDHPEILDNTGASKRLCSATEGALDLPASSTSSATPGPEFVNFSGSSISNFSSAIDTGECTIDAESSNTAYLLWALVWILIGRFCFVCLLS